MKTVTSQAEFEEKLKEGLRSFKFKGFSGVLKGDTHIHLYGNSQAYLLGNSHTTLHQSAFAALWGNCHARLHDSSHAVLRGNSSAELHGTPYSSPHVSLQDNSYVILRGHSHADLWGHSFAEIRESSHAILRGYSQAILWGHSHADLRDDSFAELWGSSSVILQGRSRAMLRDFSIGYLRSKRAKAKAGKRATIIEMIYPEDIKQWAALKRVCIRRNRIMLWKAVRQNGTDFYTGQVNYDTKKEITAPDWDSKYSQECGFGLHLADSPSAARLFCSRDQRKTARLFRVSVNINDCICFPGMPHYPMKLRARACRKVKEYPISYNLWEE